MAIVNYSAGALRDLDRLCDFLLKDNAQAAAETVALINSAVDILEQHPLIGRPAESGLREMVISRGKSGYIALYRYDEERDRVLMLAIRHQREAGYAGNL